MRSVLYLLERIRRTRRSSWLEGRGWRLFGWTLILNGARRVRPVMADLAPALALAPGLTAPGAGLVVRHAITAPVPSS
jgi:hypothetical protein